MQLVLWNEWRTKDLKFTVTTSKWVVTIATETNWSRLREKIFAARPIKKEWVFCVAFPAISCLCSKGVGGWGEGHALGFRKIIWVKGVHGYFLRFMENCYT